MPEPLTPTLVEIRNMVLIRGGHSIAGNQAQDFYPLVDELIRKSLRELHMEAPWLRLKVRATQALILDEKEYDAPDDALFNKIETVSVINSEGKEYCLHPGDSGDIRNATTTSGQPRWYTITNGALFVFPAPDATWTTLVFDYYQAPSQLVSEADRPNMEAEALTQRATAYLKRHTGLGGDWNSDMNDHRRYVDQLREEQGQIRQISMLGRPALRRSAGWNYRESWRSDWVPRGF